MQITRTPVINAAAAIPRSICADGWN